ncbi:MULTISPECIES: MerR family transcriptional regulator [Paenibacillus]|uniref:MerR family transcriptional regulator n=1 Tax=Paenibacillus alvei TaxID=44250 RepID=A0ABT4EDB1_PAEAL|nr:MULTISPECIES: MerR family transcriptional regulator [Paenibacillus]EPY11857.1 transcriptional regulator [Paenibacillus alvei A6-6i-x]MCY9531731.1 MerR family transcriptional regulator [Paenibacillus alvei]SDG05036.1 DNA-binding transcriptional regulator, MerR family [Paenibacillus sp. cl6col]
MHIRELSKLTGVSLRSLRYYEQKHLLSPARSENGYRIYEDIDVQRVQLIQLFLKLGVSTDEIARLIQNCEGLPGRNSNNSNHQAECAAAFYEERLQEIREQIQLLREAELQLEKLVTHWKQHITDN